MGDSLAEEKYIDASLHEGIQKIRVKALRDAAQLIRAEEVCCLEEGHPDDWKHDCCKYSEYAARNVERLIGTPHDFDGSIYDWEAEYGKKDDS